MSHSHNALRITWTLTVCTALALLGDATIYPVLPAQTAELGLTAWHVGWLLSINRLVRPPLNMLGGYLSHRMGPKAPFIIGLAIGTLSTLGYGLVRGFWPLLALRALWGVAWALLVVAAYGMVLDSSGKSMRGRLTGTYASFSFFGGALGAMGGGFLVDSIGFSAAMIILGIVSALSLLGALTLPPIRRNVSSLPDSHAEEAVANADPVKAVSPPSMRQVLHQFANLSGRLRLIFALNFVHRFFFAGIFYSTLGFYLARTVTEPIRVGTIALGIASLTSVLLFARNVVTVVVGPGLGYLSDRLRDRAIVLVLGEVAGALGFLCFATHGSLWILGLGVILTAVAYGIVPPMLVSWLGDSTASSHRSTMVGAYQTMGDLGSGLGPLVAYVIVGALGARSVYGLSAAILVLTVPIILRARAGGQTRQVSSGPSTQRP